MISNRKRLLLWDRPTRWKIYYLVAFFAIGAISGWIILVSDSKVIAAALVGLALVIPGRICGRFYGDFHTGVKLMAAKRYPDAVMHFRRFLMAVRWNPGLKKLIWFVWSFYTRDIEAMTLNNIGASLLEEGELDSAEAELAQALAIDPRYSIPHYNLAVIAELRGNRVAAEESLAEAIHLGYRRTRIDNVVHKAGLILSSLEGRKIGAAHAG